jgi:hypothetical protein
MRDMHKFIRLGAALLALAVVTPAIAAPKDKIKVRPDTFIDPTGDLCGGPGTAADPNDAAAKWVNRAGVTGRPGDFGLLMRKSAPTPTCAAALALVTGFEGNVVEATDLFGYAYRNDEYCGAGAPRFNVTVEDADGTLATYAAGCANPSTTESTSGSWTTKAWSPANFSFLSGDPTVPLVGSEIVRVLLVFDEGPGENHLDNIRYNNLVATSPAVGH